MLEQKAECWKRSCWQKFLGTGSLFWYLTSGMDSHGQACQEHDWGALNHVHHRALFGTLVDGVLCCCGCNRPFRGLACRSLQHLFCLIRPRQKRDETIFLSARVGSFDEVALKWISCLSHCYESPCRCLSAVWRLAHCISLKWLMQSGVLSDCLGLLGPKYLH
jgi:hypothetical protein